MSVNVRANTAHPWVLLTLFADCTCLYLVSHFASAAKICDCATGQWRAVAEAARDDLLFISVDTPVA